MHSKSGTQTPEISNVVPDPKHGLIFSRTPCFLALVLLSCFFPYSANLLFICYVPIVLTAFSIQQREKCFFFFLLFIFFKLPLVAVFLTYY